MKVLVVIAHPNPESFNHAILDSFTKGLQEGGHTFDVLDLYIEKFDPCFGMADFAPYTGGELSADVVAQQERIKNADAIAFIYPIWWYSYPAILKGWFDRVFTLGFAFDFGEQGLVGLLTDKKVLMINTTMGPEESYTGSGIGDAMKKLPSTDFQLVCGVPELEFITFYAVQESDELRKGYLEKAFRLGREF